MDFLGIRTLPFLSRRNFYYEFRHLLPWSVLAGLVEGQFASVVVAKSFNGSPLQIAIATATPIAALTFSLFWGMLCVGRPKIRLAIIFAAGTALCAGTAGAIPTTPNGAIWFLCQMAAAQILLAGVVTVRSAIWKSNYPQKLRGQITARLQALRFVVTVTTVLIASAICDKNASAYRFIYPIAGVLGLFGAMLLPRLHIRGERSELRSHRKPGSEDMPREGMIEPFSLTALLSPGHVLGQMYKILRGDRRFRHYCIAQLLTGIANLMTVSLAATIITRDLDMDPAWDFWVCTAIIVAVPRLAMLGSLRRWGLLFDRVGVVRFRVVNVIMWTSSLVLGLIACYIAVDMTPFGNMQSFLAIVFFSLRALAQGMGFAGGALAWNLGHLHFAKPEEAEMYMGIHVSLTGLRGIVAPLGGIWLWHNAGWPAWSVWLLAIFFSLLSLLVFYKMARQELAIDAAHPFGDAA